MTLIETIPGESEIDFRNAIDAILQAILPAMPKWWRPYELRGIYECRGILFRHFFCIAGSVECHLWVNAKQLVRRIIVLSDEGA